MDTTAEYGCWFASIQLPQKWAKSAGAFVVVPRSHRRHGAVTQRVYRARPQTDASQQFLMLPADDPILSRPTRPHLVGCEAGRRRDASILMKFPLS